MLKLENFLTAGGLAVAVAAGVAGTGAGGHSLDVGGSEAISASALLMDASQTQWPAMGWLHGRERQPEHSTPDRIFVRTGASTTYNTLL